MKIYPEPVETAIAAEIARLQPRYDAFMKMQGETPDEKQLRAWAIENLHEQIILEEEAKAAKVTVDALMKQIVAKVPTVTVEEARAYFKANPKQFIAPERVHARHIVLHRQEHEATEAMTTLLNLRKQIVAGATTWEAAVAQFSSCSSNDDLGFFARGQMVEAFETAAFATPEGEISDVIESEFGWHLINVVAHLPEEPMLFEEAKESLMKSLQEERERHALETFVDSRKGGFATVSK